MYSVFRYYTIAPETGTGVVVPPFDVSGTHLHHTRRSMPAITDIDACSILPFSVHEGIEGLGVVAPV